MNLIDVFEVPVTKQVDKGTHVDLVYVDQLCLITFHIDDWIAWDPGRAR